MISQLAIYEFLLSPKIFARCKVQHNFRNWLDMISELTHMISLLAWYVSSISWLWFPPFPKDICEVQGATTSDYWPADFSGRQSVGRNAHSPVPFVYSDFLIGWSWFLYWLIVISLLSWYDFLFGFWLQWPPVCRPERTLSSCPFCLLLRCIFQSFSLYFSTPLFVFLKLLLCLKEWNSGLTAHSLLSCPFCLHVRCISPSFFLHF